MRMRGRVRAPRVLPRPVTNGRSGPRSDRLSYSIYYQSLVAVNGIGWPMVQPFRI
jgi:hypothetical protein